MEITSKEFPGKIIAWWVTFGILVIFCYDIFDGIDMAFEGYDLFYEYLDCFYYWWYGG